MIVVILAICHCFWCWEISNCIGGECYQALDAVRQNICKLHKSPTLPEEITRAVRCNSPSFKADIGHCLFVVSDITVFEMYILRRWRMELNLNVPRIQSTQRLKQGNMMYQSHICDVKLWIRDILVNVLNVSTGHEECRIWCMAFSGKEGIHCEIAAPGR